MNRLFVAFDGDNAGQHIGQAILMDDAGMLNEMSQKINAGNQIIQQWVEQNGGQMISFGGDEGTFLISPEFESELENLRAKYQDVAGFSATIGTGLSLSQAGKSLIAGKLTGKDQIVRYSDEVEHVLSQAHNAVAEGTANEEQQKMDEHYLDATMGAADEFQMTDRGLEDQSEEDMMRLPEEDDEYQEQEDFDESYPESNQELSEDENYQPDMDLDEDQMMYEDENVTPDMDFDQSQQDVSEEINDMPIMPEGGEEMPGEESQPEESDFENEVPIQLDAKNAVTENGEEEKKADEQVDEDFAMDAGNSSEYMPSEDMPAETNPDMLQDELEDVDGKEEILQQIAANLAAFKENRDLIEQIKQAKPDLYESILGLLHNMIELARIINPDFQNESQANEATETADASQKPEDMISDAAGESDLPKQRG
jgi:hypothetical protein